MSIEIKNFCINVSVRPKSEPTNLDVESIRSAVLQECRQMVQDAVVESRER